MKRILLLTVAVLCLAGLASAQEDVGSIDIFSDGLYTSCNVVDVAGLVSVYVVHTNANDGSTASQWKVELGAGVTMTSVGSINAYPTAIGDPLVGISIAYGACQTIANNLLVTMNFIGSGTSATCALMSIVPDPTSPSGLVEIVDCARNKITLEKGGQARVNPDGTCNCTVPVQETTWGGIKSLYGG